MASASNHSSAPPTTSNTSKPPPTTSADADADADDDENSSLSGLSDISESDPTLQSLQSARAAELQALASTSSFTTFTTTPSSHLQPAPTFTTPFSTLQTLPSEKSAMQSIAAHPRSVLLFTHPSFPICKLMTSHLNRVAAGAAYLVGSSSSKPTEKATEEEEGGGGGEGSKGEYENVLFIELEAEKAPFLTKRLKVRVLPVVVGYVDGEEVGRLVGFDGLGRGGRREGGWMRVAMVLRSWGVLGAERLVGEESDGEEEEEDGEEDGEGGDEGEKGSWIGRGGRANKKVATRGTGRDDDDEDDWN